MRVSVNEISKIYVLAANRREVVKMEGKFKVRFSKYLGFLFQIIMVPNFINRISQYVVKKQGGLDNNDI